MDKNLPGQQQTVVHFINNLLYGRHIARNVLHNVVMVIIK